MASNWYALHVKPQKERAVCNLLQADGVQVYFPVLKVKPVNPRSRKERPFFPGYLFVKLDLDDMGTNALRWTVGTHGLVEFGGLPAAVPENLILELSQRLAEIGTPDKSSQRSFKKGDRVRIVDGVFEGYEAIFDARLPGKHRVQVLLVYLSDQPKRLQIDSSHISKNDEKRR